MRVGLVGSEMCIRDSTHTHTHTHTHHASVHTSDTLPLTELFPTLCTQEKAVPMTTGATIARLGSARLQQSPSVAMAAVASPQPMTERA